MGSCLDCEGDCCRRYRVPITGADVRRLTSSGRDPGLFIDWQPVGTMYCTYPDVRLSDGYYYMVLGRKGDGACVLSSRENGSLRCSIHGRHPYLCRLYPFSQDGTPISHRLCKQEVGLWPDLKALVLEREREWDEYSSRVRQWNATSMGGRLPGDFLKYILSR